LVLAQPAIPAVLTRKFLIVQGVGVYDFVAVGG
jgi:hypothetical protein